MLKRYLIYASQIFVIRHPIMVGTPLLDGVFRKITLVFRQLNYLIRFSSILFSEVMLQKNVLGVVLKKIM